MYYLGLTFQDILVKRSTQIDIFVGKYFAKVLLCSQMKVLFHDCGKVLLGILKGKLTCQDTVPTVRNAGNKLSKDMGEITSKNNGKITNSP